MSIALIHYLDPFYLIPIDTVFFIIYETIEFLLTLDKANIFSNLRFICAALSDLIGILCFSIYLEIIIFPCFINRDIEPCIIKIKEKLDYIPHHEANEDKDDNDDDTK